MSVKGRKERGKVNKIKTKKGNSQKIRMTKMACIIIFICCISLMQLIQMCKFFFAEKDQS